MTKESKQLLQQLDTLFEARKKDILNTPNAPLSSYSGRVYYVSTQGDDRNTGLSPDAPWQSLARVSSAELFSGDAVLFRRGDIFRGSIVTCSGVTYSAYGEGEKPCLYGSECDLADSALWEQYDSAAHIWRTKEKYLDIGTLVFNGGEAVSRKLIPSYKNGGFVCRDNEALCFEPIHEMSCDLDIYWEYDSRLTDTPSNGECFPIPLLDEDSRGYIYLRCDKGEPFGVFNSIEPLSRVHMFNVGENTNVSIDNLCIKYVGMHGVAAGGHSVGLCVTNCEFGYIGGCLQHYLGTDPNYPQGGRGSVTRFGNAIEIYGGCDAYTASGNYIYEVYDAGITHQVTTDRKVTMQGIKYTDNLIEKCVYGIEYFLAQTDGENESLMRDIDISGNFIRLTGYGWGQQRHNKDTPAHIKSWSFSNPAEGFCIHDNILDRSAYRMLHLVALKDEYCPLMQGNTYVQHRGSMLGQYGGNEKQEPPVLKFDGLAKEHIEKLFKDTESKVYFID